MQLTEQKTVGPLAPFPCPEPSRMSGAVYCGFIHSNLDFFLLRICGESHVGILKLSYFVYFPCFKRISWLHVCA